MAVKCSEITKVIETVAPRNLAESWDNVGLQIGSFQKRVKKVLLTLDVTEAVVREAVVEKADMIIAHHPFIFNGIKSICTDAVSYTHLVETAVRKALYQQEGWTS